MVDCVAVVKKYFEVWNAHDVAGIQALHAPSSTLTDWDASHGPTNEAVAKGIGGIWEAVPNIKIEVLNVFTCASYPKCVANIKVIVGNEEGTILNVCDVFEFDEAGLVTSLVSTPTDWVKIQQQTRGSMPGAIVRDALRATISLPGILPPVVDGNELLVDGAVLNNFPVDVMRDMHRGFVIGSDVTRQPEGLKIEADLCFGLGRRALR